MVESLVKNTKLDTMILTIVTCIIIHMCVVPFIEASGDITEYVYESADIPEGLLMVEIREENVTTVRECMKR